MIFAIDYSLMRTQVFKQLAFVGLENYGRLLSDPRFLTNLFNSTVFVAAGVALTWTFGLALALFLRQQTWGNAVLRTIILVPWVTNQVVLALMWKWLLGGGASPISYLLATFGFGEFNPLIDTHQALPTLTFINAWRATGFAMLLMLAGLAAIPIEVEEAAQIDGASRIQQIWFVLIPLLRPISLVCMVTLTISFFNIIVLPLDLTGGGPLNSSELVSLRLYREGFQYLQHRRRLHDHGRHGRPRSRAVVGLLPADQVGVELPMNAKRTWAGFVEVARWIGIVFVALIILTPFLWSLSTSLKVEQDVLAFPPQFIPWRATLENYREVLATGFPRYLWNSFVVSSFTVLVVLVVSIHAGYAVARYDFPGKSLMLFFILAGMAMGELATVLPLYFFASNLQIIDTYLVLVIANSAFIAPLSIWFMQGYFRSIPPQMEEAALIDGTGRLGALYLIVLPSAAPGLVTVSLISFVASWNEFILALVLTSSGNMRTIPVGLHLYMTDYGVQWGNLTAAGILSIVPILVLFLLLQRHFLRGLTAGSTTGF
jgi:ABC-type glycerol-3-phosphate transport system permease component